MVLDFCKVKCCIKFRIEIIVSKVVVLSILKIRVWRIIFLGPTIKIKVYGLPFEINHLLGKCIDEDFRKIS